MPKASPAEHPTQPPSPTNYVFIDYENVSADGLDLLDPARFHAIIFCSEHQKTLPIEQNCGARRRILLDRKGQHPRQKTGSIVTF